VNDLNQVNIPSKPGAYGLHLRLTRSQKLQIGGLGDFTFPPGEYVYVGSALGPGGLRARVSRHLRGDGRWHWHIDWLRPFVEVVGYWYQITGTRLECCWSRLLAAETGAGIPVPHFGASDCRSKVGKCDAHLILFNLGIAAERIQEALVPGQSSCHDQLKYVGFTSDSQL
jgi:Uri superfamily endonuclease